MISLNHQAPAVNQSTLVQRYSSSQRAAVLKDVFGFETKSLAVENVQLVGWFGSRSEPMPRAPPPMMCLVEVGFSKPDAAVCCGREKES